MTATWMRRWVEDERARSRLAWGAVGLAFLVLSAAARWNWLHANLDDLASGLLPDDAFYYFEIAQRVWAGQGVTFDGTAPATGLHLLWLGLLLPFFLVYPHGSTEPILAALWLATGLTALTSTLVARIAWMWTRRWDVALVLGACLTLNPFVLRESINGLETALGLAAVAATVLALVRYMEAPSRRRAWELTGLVVLTLLARSDALVVLAPACAVLLLRRAWWPDAVRVAGGAVLGVAVLSLLNWLRTGSLLQSSAAAVPWVIRANWNLAHPGATPEQVRENGLDVFVNALRFTENSLGPPQMQVLWLCAGALLLVCLVRLALRRGVTVEDVSAPTLVVGLAVGLVALHFIHGYGRWYPRSWYFVSVTLVVCLAPAALVRLLPSRDVSPRWVSVGAALALVFGAVTAGRDMERLLAQWDRHNYPWQREMLEAGRVASARLPPDAVLGSFNSGIIAYATEQTVVNLDGVVNEDAARATRNSQLLAYMRERKIQYLVDYPAMWWSRGAFMHSTWPYWGGTASEPISVFRADVPGIGWPRAQDSVVVAELPAP